MSQHVLQEVETKKKKGKGKGEKYSLEDAGKMKDHLSEHGLTGLNMV